MKVLFITKDKGGFNAAYQYHGAMQTAGHETVAVTEGLSTALWEQQGIQPYFKGAVDFKKEPFDCAVDEILDAIAPEVIVATLGAPINLEAEFSKAANRRGIALAWIEDVWGAHVRSDAAPQLILCFDHIGQMISARKERFRNTRISVVGDFGLATMQGLAKIPQEMAAKAAELRNNQRLIHLGGQGIFTSDMITLLRDSLARTRARYAVIPRLHPKYKDTPHMAHWQELLGTLPKGMLTDIPGANSDQLTVLCDITWSTFGTGMRYAAYYENMVVSILTPASREAMVRETGLEEYPLVTVGAAIEVREATNLDHIMEQYLSVQAAQRKYAKPEPFEPARAIRAIEEIAL